MYRQSVRNDNQVTTPLIYTNSGTIRRTQGQSLLSGSHQKEPKRGFECGWNDITVDWWGHKPVYNLKDYPRVYTSFRSGWRSLKPSLAECPLAGQTTADSVLMLARRGVRKERCVDRCGAMILWNR